MLWGVMVSGGGLDGGKGKVWYFVLSLIGCFGDFMYIRVGYGE